MTKQQWRNLWHSYRWMRRRATVRESIAWCATYSQANGAALRRVVNQQGAAAAAAVRRAARHGLRVVPA